MVELFTSTGCDHCDYGPDLTKLHRGFAVLNHNHRVCKTVYYAFRTKLDAERWQTAMASASVETVMLEVWSIEPFRWRLTDCSGVSIVLADSAYEVFDDHRYEPLPHRAFIAPRKE